DDERLYFGKAIPRAWTASGKPVSIEQAPTRFGRVNFHLVARPEKKQVTAAVALAAAGSPKEIHVKLRVPKQTPLTEVTVNGKPAKLGGQHGDTVVIATGTQ